MDGILKASYGDIRQREVNNKAVDPIRGHQIYEKFKSDQQAQLRPEMEISPGILVDVKPGMRRGARGPPKAYEVPTQQLQPAVAKLEDAMRTQLRKRSAVHTKDRTILLKAFGKVLNKKDVELRAEDKVTLQQFSDAWRMLGVLVPTSSAAAVFNKYGQDINGRLPIMVFVEALLLGAPRLVMAANDIQKGAYKAGHPATHMGKILYPECKSGVFPPSDWNPQLAKRSATKPDARLQLEFVYGFDGQWATSPNIFYIRTGEIVYYAAAVGIVYNKAAHTQRFFLGHDDDIQCLALHPNRQWVATGQMGKDPAVLIWDSTTMEQLVKINHGYGNRGVQAASFSPDGKQLVTVCTDNCHTLFVWDWQRKQKLVERKSQAGAPPAVYGVVWSFFEADRMVTFGANHVKFWKLGQDAQQEHGIMELPVQVDAGVYLKGNTHSVLAACFLPGGLLLTGNEDGQVCVWRGCKCIREVPAHAKGPATSRPDGKKAFGGLRCLVLQPGNKTLLSGGADGYVIRWDVSSGDLGPQLQRLPLVRADQVGQVTAPSLRALDCFPGSDVFVAGTNSCDIWEVDSTPEVLIYGQSSDVYGLAMNPAYPHIFAVMSESGSATIISAAAHKAIRVIAMGAPAAVAAFSKDGKQLAVGLKSGGIKIMEFHPHTSQAAWIKVTDSAIDELKYSPDGRFLAVGSHDQAIDILDTQAGNKRVARCVGHSSAIQHLDWSKDGKTIRSTDQAYEVLHFDARTGKQVKENQRDTKWQSWSSTLGFPVMGIWPPDSDGTDVNACERSPCGGYLITADDFGKVKLFNWPCVVQHAPAHTYKGHSSHVMNVRWSVDSQYTVSVGGKDRGVFQWRVIREGKKADTGGLKAPWAVLDNQGVVYGPPGAAAGHR